MTPEVCVVMDHKPTSAIKFLSDIPSIAHCVLQQLIERLMQFRQITDLGGPVVHFRVDIDGVLAVPGGLKLLIPESLQIRCHCVGATAGNQQISAKLKIQTLETDICFTSLHTLESFVGGQINLWRTELKLNF